MLNLQICLDIDFKRKVNPDHLEFLFARKI